MLTSRQSCRCGSRRASRACIAALALAVMMGAAGSSHAAKNHFVGFSGPIVIPTGHGPISVALGDINGDGNLDLAVSDFLQGSVSIKLGLGDGAFVDNGDLAIGPFPNALDFGDIDNDGDLDLVVTINPTGARADGVAVFLNDSAGAFTFAGLHIVGPSPESVELVDLDKDGRLDLVVGVFNDVAVLIGQGDGDFNAPTSLAAGASFVVAATGDMNRDGLVDVVAASFVDSVVSILLGHGDATFADPMIFPAGAQPRSIAIGDVNGDGWPDIALAGGSPDSLGALSLVLGVDGASFDPPIQLLAAADNRGSGVGPWDISIVDLDFDNDADIVASNEASGDVTVLLNDGAGGFEAPRFFPAGASARALAVGDINNNGSADLVVASLADDAVVILLNLTTNPYDLNNDGVIGSVDLAILLASWGTTGEQSGADFNDDGVVNGVDLAALLVHWSG